MWRVMRWFLLMLCGIASIPVSYLIHYDLTVFQPRIGEIEIILSKASPEERYPSVQLWRLSEVSTWGRVDSVVGKMLVRELQVPPYFKGADGWHATNFMWWALVAIHISKEEQIAIYASRSYMGNGRYGFSSEAEARFGRPLSNLNIEELATIVALSHAPSNYLTSPERLVRRRDWLLSEMQNDS